ncbi:LysM peptidoglycan-binding domain-containing protein [Cellulomonas sp. Sa3CUA2]|uniref:LysM peptidoglycan-binding domain-containing protein n=1 Tax=Cellulomonas avistercoris TaxID=2762242 RepID=A0ABR8QC80_9CELL|nr:LysM peptidoglycan-binding domain-containing protein [Cellulomonas avistercoris]
MHRWAPGLVRRALAVAVAAGVGLTGAAGAYATADAPPAPVVVTVDLGWSPTATDPAAPSQGATEAASSEVVPVASQVPTITAAAAAAAPAGSVEVRPGDTLWGLAARALGPGASDAAIAAEWPRWYAANAATIGPDPDVLQPGQVLVVPTHPDGGAR